MISVRIKGFIHLNVLVNSILVGNCVCLSVGLLMWTDCSFPVMTTSPVYKNTLQ
jgi:hypothetical protein